MDAYVREKQNVAKHDVGKRKQYFPASKRVCWSLVDILEELHSATHFCVYG